MSGSHERGRNGTEANYGSWLRVHSSRFTLVIMAYEKKPYKKVFKAKRLLFIRPNGVN